ncbi:MAG: hypothetical protein ACXABI_13765 [Candidatus Hodarchaeales archaeon]
MECKILLRMFRNEETRVTTNHRTHFLETLLALGEAKKITIEFMTDYCNHSSKPSSISWKDIPILRLKCEGTECDIHIQNNTQNIVFFLLQNLSDLPFVKFISLLIDLKIPSWDRSYEFIVIIDSLGNTSLIPSNRNFSSLDLKKLIKHLEIHTERKISSQNEEELIDILFSDKIPLHEFKIRI